MNFSVLLLDGVNVWNVKWQALFKRAPNRRARWTDFNDVDNARAEVFYQNSTEEFYNPIIWPPTLPFQFMPLLPHDDRNFALRIHRPNDDHNDDHYLTNYPGACTGNPPPDEPEWRIKVRRINRRSLLQADISNLTESPPKDPKPPTPPSNGKKRRRGGDQTASVSAGTGKHDHSASKASSWCTGDALSAVHHARKNQNVGACDLG